MEESIVLVKRFVWIFVRCYEKNSKELFDKLNI